MSTTLRLTLLINIKTRAQSKVATIAMQTARLTKLLAVQFLFWAEQ